MLRELFELFGEVNQKLDNNIYEISVRQSRMTLCFEELSRLTCKDYDTVNNICKLFSISEITAFQDVLYVHFDRLSENILQGLSDTKCPWLPFYQLIFQLRDLLCTCPALEYVIGDSYIKIYIDLPNIHVKDVASLDKLFGAEGVLELNNQRPYVLYVRDWSDED